MNKVKKQIIYWLPVYIYMILIFYFSSQSYIAVGGGVGKGIWFMSYIKHFIEYFILGILVYRGFFNSKFKKGTINLSLIFSGLYSISDEIHQYFVPGRNFSFFDLGADFFGVIIGIMIISFFYRRIYKF